MQVVRIHLVSAKHQSIFLSFHTTDELSVDATGQVSKNTATESCFYRP